MAETWKSPRKIDEEIKEYRRNLPEADALPGLELHEIVEWMSPVERAEYKQKLLDEINDREKLVWLINEVEEVENG